MSDEQKDDGGPAFPTKGSAHEIPGMTLRDWFAGQVLPSVYLSYPNNSPEQIAKWTWIMSDAMIEARKQ